MLMNFGTLKTVQTTSSSKRLKPWGIYKVKFEGCRVDHIQGKKDPSKTYDIFKVRFEGDEGYYEESIFFPTENDVKRPTRKNKEGHEIEMVSNFERTMAFLAQLGEVVNHDGFEKLRAASDKIKSFDELCNLFIKITDPKKGTEMYLKLIGKTDTAGMVQPCLPYFVALGTPDTNGVRTPFPSDNFVSLDVNKLAFSAYEEGNMKKFKEATPTNMDKVVKEEPIESSQSESSIDIDSLL